jgi:hypothetical protein
MEFHPEFKNKLLPLLYAGESFNGREPGADDRALDAEGLLRKFVYHCSTLDYLLKKTPSPLNNSARFIDFASIITIIRAAFESVLTFLFIFKFPDDKEELDLRYWLWLYGGIWQITREEPIQDENKAIYKALKDDIKILETKIKSNRIFISLPPAFAKRVLKKRLWRIVKKTDDNWETLGWAHIGTQLGFEDKIAKQIYSFLSAYAHSDSLCISHIRVAKSESDRLKLLDGAFDILEYLIDVMTAEYVRTIERMLK